MVAKIIKCTLIVQVCHCIRVECPRDKLVQIYWHELALNKYRARKCDTLIMVINLYVNMIRVITL